jgi:hypothetical protein
MRVTVLWEDSRGVETKGFGPHELLLACVADKIGRERRDVAALVKSVAKKGVGNVIKALKTDLAKLRSAGPVFAVIDRDKAREIWKPAPLPADCMSAIRTRIATDVGGSEYELVFLVQNMESLIHACGEGSLMKPQTLKPNPDQRDRILGRAAWEASPAVRLKLLLTCGSFGRLVDRVGAVLSNLPQASMTSLGH